MTRLGVIGGSGLYQLAGAEGGAWAAITTPWGRPSDELFIGRLGETELAFLPRHGRGHVLAPHEIDFRANIAALKMAGCTHLLAVSACGSFREELPPGTFVVVDQYDDRTRGRAASFFGDGIVAHAAFADPTCPVLRSVAAEALGALGLPTARGGSFLIIEGPRFSTRAESRRFRAEGADIVGMTGMPEAVLAREAELPYACVAMVTDYDSWREGEAVDVAEVVRVLRANAAAALRLVAEVARRLPAAPPSPPAITRALDHAIITPRDRWPEDAAARLKAIAPRLFPRMTNADIAALIRTIPDFPKPGIQFRDVTTLLLDGPGFRLTIDRLADAVRGRPLDAIAGIEARGFLFGAALAHALGLGVILLRKKNKLPGAVIGVNYALEYGQDRIEVHADAVRPGARVLLVDDLIATGGTALAGVDLLRQAGATVERAAFVVDLPDLGGTARLRAAGVEVVTLVGFEGD